MPRDLPLYPTEDEIARKVLGKRAREWPSIARSLAGKGLPPVDPQFGGRYWPAVKQYLDTRNRIGTVVRSATPTDSTICRQPPTRARETA